MTSNEFSRVDMSGVLLSRLGRQPFLDSRKGIARENELVVFQYLVSVQILACGGVHTLDVSRRQTKVVILVGINQQHGGANGHRQVVEQFQRTLGLVVIQGKVIDHQHILVVQPRAESLAQGELALLAVCLLGIVAGPRTMCHAATTPDGVTA